jgi:hypothetical protein
VQCEDLYELISCLLPEVTASPAQHCTYTIFGQTSWVQPILFAFLNIMLSYRLFLSLFNAVICIVLPGLLVKLCFFEVLLEAAKSGGEPGACSFQVRTSAILNCPCPFDSCSPFASTRTLSIFRTGISSRESLDSLLDVRPKAQSLVCLLPRPFPVSPSALQRRHPQLCSVDRGNTRMQTASANELETTKLLQE